MPMYEYKCPGCESRVVSGQRGDRLQQSCRYCGHPGPLVRRFSISIERPMPEHFNGSVNRVVSSNRQYDRELARVSEEHSSYLNMDVKYERVDGEDTKSLGVTGEGLDSTNRVRMAQGMRPINTDAL